MKSSYGLAKLSNGLEGKTQLKDHSRDTNIFQAREKAEI